MKKLSMLVGIGIISVGIVLMSASPALAWHPKGVIIKKVQNITTGGALTDANDAKTAITAKPGDILKYVIEIRNDGEVVNNDHNDLVVTTLDDTLPLGVELVGNPGKRVISEKNLGTVKPKQKMVKEYTVKVVSKTNGALINNEACFTGDSKANDSKQKGCDTAKVTVKVPEEPKKPETPKTPEQPKPTPKVETPAPAPAKLPETGMGAFGALAGTSAFGYAAHLYLRSKQTLKRTLRLKK